MANFRGMPGATPAWYDVSARLAQPRRVAVAVLVGIAAVCGIDAARPTPPPSRGVWVAARNLSGGEPLAPGDLRLQRLPITDVPAGAVGAATVLSGRLLAAPMRQGEPVTDVRLLSPSLLSALDQPGAVAVPVRVADGPAAVALVHVGDLVDVIAAADAETGTPVVGSTVVHDVRVLAVPTDSAAGSEPGSDDAGLLIVAASPHQAAALAQAATASRLSVAVRRPA